MAAPRTTVLASRRVFGQSSAKREPPLSTDFHAPDARLPLDGARAVVEVFSEYVDGLDGIDGSSHLVVMGFLHLSARSVLKTRPRKVDLNGPEKGVFGTRSPARPNPISLSVVPLVRRDGLLLTVDPLDLVDGTPLVDLKAYSPGWNGVFSARHAFRANSITLDHQRLVVCLERDLENFMGAAASAPAARWGLCAAFVGTRALGVDPRELRVVFERGGRSVELRAVLDSVPAQVDDWGGAFAVRTTAV